MITPEKMADVLRVLEGSNLNIARKGQSRIWYEALTFAIPAAVDSDIGEAVMVIITQRPKDQGNRMVNTRELLDEVRKIRTRNLELAEKYARQIERTGTDVSDDNLRQIMVDTGAGLDATDVAERARKRAES